MRSVENRLARKYERRSLVADMFSLHGHYDLARTWLTASRDEAIRAASSVIGALHTSDELRTRFKSCLIAERYLRRTERRPSSKSQIEEAA